MPFGMHPVFAVQPATACCCHGCLEQWHRIPKGRSLSVDEQTYIVNVLNCWLHKELHQFEINHPVQCCANLPGCQAPAFKQICQ